jgi:hypothetical protein
MRAIGSIAFIVNKYGLISADYEYVDYTKASFKSYDYDYNTENESINNTYRATSNIRVGTEWRYSNFSIRGGYAYYASPYKAGVNDGKQNIFSAGIGYRSNYFFIDFTYNRATSSEDYYMYESQNVFVEPALIENKKNNYLLTVGFKY